MKKRIGTIFCMLLLTTITLGTTATQASDIHTVDISVKGGLGLQVTVTNTGTIPIEPFTNGCTTAPGALGTADFRGRTILNKQFGGGVPFEIDSLPIGESVAKRTFPWLHRGIAFGTVNITVYENGDLFNENGIENEVYGTGMVRVMVLFTFFVIPLSR